MDYRKGLHSLLTLNATTNQNLIDLDGFVDFTTMLLEKHQIILVGKATYSFEGGGFTCVFALSESHISCHTWPEFNMATIDIYLCNYSRNNDSAVKQITQEYLNYFKATATDQHLIRR